MWDQRYAAEHYVYGTQPNDYLRAQADQIPRGRVLCIGEGEGRNAVWLAGLGFQVSALDASAVGLSKAQKLARQKGVEITSLHADLAEFDLGQAAWDGIVSIFCHLPAALRRKVHMACVQALRPGGMLLLEAYTPEQLKYRTGGPPKAEMMMDADSLREEFHGLHFLQLRECLREVHEGELHCGQGAVVQMLAQKTD